MPTSSNVLWRDDFLNIEHCTNINKLDLMSGNYHQERSRLIQQQKEEIKSIEKEIKSKKGILKEQCQRRLEEAQKRHDEEIREFESRYGNEEEKKRNSKQAGASSSSGDGGGSISVKTVIFEEKQWNSLSRSELEVECKKRGINSKGGKEDLVTRLFIFTADQKSKLSKISQAEERGSEVAMPRDNTCEKLELPSTKGFTVVSSANKLAPEINYSEAGGTGRRKGRSQSKKIDHRKNVRPGQSSWAAFCARNDIPRKKNAQLNIYENSNSENSDNEDGALDQSKYSSEESSGSDSNSEELDEEEINKRNKRRAVMIKVVEKMFSTITINEKKNGLKLSEIEGQLTRLNVKNFKPELLGYESIEEWILSLPKNILTYDECNQLIFPPGHKVAASNSRKKDDPYYVDSLSDRGEESDGDDFFI